MFTILLTSAVMVILIIMVKQAMAQGTSESIYYYHLDHLGTPIMLTDSNQAIAWDATYDPFGKANIVTASITNNLRFLGQYYDSESGLNYNLHRYYWAEIGRYISPDKWNIATANLPMQNWPREAFYIYGKTIKKALMLDRGKIIEEILDSLHPYNYFLDDPLNQNLYNYVKSNPLIFTDPYGLFKCDTYRLVECFFHLLGSIGEGMGLALVRCAFTPNPVCCYVGLGIAFAPAVIATTHGCINRYCKKEPCIKQKCQ